MTEKIQSQNDANNRLQEELSQMRVSVETPMANMATESKKEADEEVLKVTTQAVKETEKMEVEVDPKSESELGLVSTILGCRENRDRIELARDLKEFVKKDDLTVDEKKSLTITHLGLASDYKLIFSPLLKQYIKDTSEPGLARSMPKYDFISPSLALIIM